MNRLQWKLLHYIDAYWEENWTSPTFREMCEHTGLASRSSVHHHLSRLVAMGVVERKDLGNRRVLYRVRDGTLS